MITLIAILIILACVVLGFFILVQNPKGGGLSGTFGSVSSQVMGVKQSSDVMEKGTWGAMGLIAALSIISVMFFASPKEKSTDQPTRNSVPTQQQNAPQQ